MLTVAPKLNVSAYVRQYMAEGIADPRDMAERLIDEVTDDDLRDYALPAFTQLCRSAIRTLRSQQPSEHNRFTRLDRPWAYSKPDGTPRWEFLRNYTVADLDNLIASYQDKVDGLMSWVDGFTAIRTEMLKRGVATCGDLPADVVDELLPAA